MSKHLKTEKPTDADLKGDPRIGQSKGLEMSQSTSEDLDDIAGENTIEGDTANDTNGLGGVSKSEALNGRRERP